MPRRAAGGGHGGGGHGGGGSERWLVSYADFITLMFVVFTVLFSMAKVESSKFQQFAKSFRAAVGPAEADLAPFQGDAQNAGKPKVIKPPARPGVPVTVPLEALEPDISKTVKPQNLAAPPEEPPPKPESTPAKPTPVPAKPANPFEPIKNTLNNAKVAGLSDVILKDTGLELHYAGNVLFDPGAWTLRPDAFAKLDAVADSLKGAPALQPIIVQCTADEQPSDPSVTALELAQNRSKAVAEYLRQRPGMDKNAFSVSQFVPSKATGATNGEVTIVVLQKTP